LVQALEFASFGRRSWRLQRRLSSAVAVGIAAMADMVAVESIAAVVRSHLGFTAVSGQDASSIKPNCPTCRI